MTLRSSFDLMTSPDEPRNFRRLEVWHDAINLVSDIYRRTESFPARERYGLTSQLRRAAVSVAANIAEGYGRATLGEYLSFLVHHERIAQ